VAPAAVEKPAVAAKTTVPAPAAAVAKRASEHMFDLCCKLSVTPAAAAKSKAAKPKKPDRAPVTESGAIADERAHFLAGLPVPATSPLAALEQTDDWKAHAAAMEDAWKRLMRRISIVDGWVASDLAPRVKPDLNLLYFFGGPDALHVMHFFPDAPSYLLCGLEPVGDVAPPEKLAPAEVDQALDSLRHALRTAIPASFFRTNEMGKDLRGKDIRGVMPIVYLFLARTRARMLEVHAIEIDPKGNVRDKPDGEEWGDGIPGVRVYFQREGKPPQMLAYVRIDLSDASLAKKPGFLAYARTFAPANGFLKAASFILHNKAFSTTRSFLLQNSAALLQDDSGIPYAAFRRTDWDFSYFGVYAAPRPPFSRSFQQDLADAFTTAGPPTQLPFLVGYRRITDSNLLLAVRRDASAAVPGRADAR